MAANNEVVKGRKVASIHESPRAPILGNSEAKKEPGMLDPGSFFAYYYYYYYGVAFDL
jgi:hypothetical protein